MDAVRSPSTCDRPGAPGSFRDPPRPSLTNGHELGVVPTEAREARPHVWPTLKTGDGYPSNEGVGKSVSLFLCPIIPPRSFNSPASDSRESSGRVDANIRAYAGRLPVTDQTPDLGPYLAERRHYLPRQRVTSNVITHPTSAMGTPGPLERGVNTYAHIREGFHLPPRKLPFWDVECRVRNCLPFSLKIKVQTRVKLRRYVDLYDNDKPGKSLESLRSHGRAKNERLCYAPVT